MDENKKAALRLRKLRSEKRLTRQELSEKSGVHVQTIYRIEMENRLPGYATMKKLAIFFVVPIEYLMGISDDDGKETNSEHAMRNYVSNFVNNCSAENLLKMYDFVKSLLKDETNL